MWGEKLFLPRNVELFIVYVVFNFNVLLRQVPNFPVFTRSGEVTVSIEMVRSDVTLTSAEIKRLQEFHHVVFRRVLRLEKDPMLFCPASAQSSYIVVPLTSGQCSNKNGVKIKVSNIRRTSVGNKIVDHSDVVGASPVGAAPTTSSFST